MNDESATVFLVDDDEAVRDALNLALRAAGYAVETFASAEAYLENCDPGRPGCLVLDVNMPGMSGLELQQALAKRDIHTPIIFLTAHGDIPMSVQAVKAGAVDFLPKPFRSRELVERVREAIALDAASRHEKARSAFIRARYERLTPREREVMAVIAGGRSSKEAARELGVSHRTIEIHRARVMGKMEVDSLPELVAQALSCGLIELTDP